MRLKVSRDFEREAAEIVRRAVLDATAGGGEAALLLSGGRTPLPVYHLLGTAPEGDLPYGRMHFFFGDERWVPPDDPGSNWGQARSAWLLPRGVPEDRVHPFAGDDPDAARRSVEAAMGRLPSAQGGGTPSFTLTLLGLGGDGHTASLFPGSPALEAPGWTAESRSPEPPHRRLTMTLGVLNASAEVWLLVRGAEKRDVLRRLLDGDPAVVAARLREDATVLADPEAAGV